MCSKTASGRFGSDISGRLLDYPVSSQRDRLRQGESHCARGFHVDHQLILRRLLCGQIVRLGALQDLVPCETHQGMTWTPGYRALPPRSNRSAARAPERRTNLAIRRARPQGQRATIEARHVCSSDPFRLPRQCASTGIGGRSARTTQVSNLSIRACQERDSGRSLAQCRTSQGSLRGGFGSCSPRRHPLFARQAVKGCPVPSPIAEDPRVIRQGYDDLIPTRSEEVRSGQWQAF